MAQILLISNKHVSYMSYLISLRIIVVLIVVIYALRFRYQLK